MSVVAIAAAGAAGVLARHGLFVLVPSLWMTMAINIIGSFALGAVFHLDLSPALRDAIGIGLLGGFTTYSTFSLQAFAELEAGRPGTFALYVAGSLVLGIGAAALGFWLTR